MSKVAKAAIALAVAVTSVDAFAVDFGDVRVNGFVSQGYIKSQENNFLVQDSTDGSFQINEAGVAVNWTASDNLRLGAQLISTDLGKDGNNDIRLDWAVADYRATDWLGIRAGKVKLPVGLYNTSRDSDFLRPMAFLPQSVYDEMQRDFMVAAYGAAAYGNFAIGSLGDVDYQVFYGKMDLDEDRLLIDNGIRSGLNDIAAGVAGAFGAPAGVDKVEYKSDYAVTVSFVWNTAVDGLRVGASYLRTQGEFESDLVDPFGVFNGIVEDFNVSANYDYMYVLSAEYTGSIYTIASEYMRRKNDVVAEGLKPLAPFIGEQYNMLTSTSEGLYVMGNVMIPQVEGLAVSFLVEQFYGDVDNRGGSKRTDFGIGLRYDFSPRWLVKAEWHKVKGTAMNLSMVNQDNPMDENWSYFAFKTSFNF